MRGALARSERVSLPRSCLPLALFLAQPFAHESAALHELEDLRELTWIEPGAVLGTYVHDHAARTAEVLAIHHLLAHGARSIVHALERCLRHRLVIGRVRKRETGALVLFE